MTSTYSSTQRRRRRSSQQEQLPWFPGILERIACCSLPQPSRQNIGDLILQDDEDDSSSSTTSIVAHDPEDDAVVLDSSTRLPISSQNNLPSSRSPNTYSMRVSPTNLSTAEALPSPTTAPSRRELDRWKHPSCMAPCCPSYAGSTATTASIMSEEEDYYYHIDNTSQTEIRSNATTLVVSHRRKKDDPRNVLLSTTLASAEVRLREQLRAEEERAQELRARREQPQRKPR